jgi:hypothetical protein
MSSPGAGHTSPLRSVIQMVFNGERSLRRRRSGLEDRLQPAEFQGGGPAGAAPGERGRAGRNVRGCGGSDMRRSNPILKNDSGQYDRLAGEWWKPRGSFTALHWLARRAAPGSSRLLE